MVIESDSDNEKKARQRQRWTAAGPGSMAQAPAAPNVPKPPPPVKPATIPVAAAVPQVPWKGESKRWRGGRFMAENANRFSPTPRSLSAEI